MQYCSIISGIPNIELDSVTTMWLRNEQLPVTPSKHFPAATIRGNSLQNTALGLLLSSLQAVYIYVPPAPSNGDCHCSTYHYYRTVCECVKNTLLDMAFDNIFCGVGVHSKLCDGA